MVISPKKMKICEPFPSEIRLNSTGIKLFQTQHDLGLSWSDSFIPATYLKGCPRGLTFTWWGCYDLCLWNKPTELAHYFLFCSCVCFCLYGPFNYFFFINSPDNSPLFLSVLSVFSLSYRSFPKNSFCPSLPVWRWYQNSPMRFRIIWFRLLQCSSF